MAKQTQAQKRYHEENVVRIPFNLNKKTDADILAYLDTVHNRQGYIKALIREDMERDRTDTPNA